MPWGIVAGAVISGAADAASKASAYGANQKAIHKSQQWLKAKAALANYTSQFQIQQAQKNIGLVNQGYANAKSSIAGAGYTAKQDIQQNQQIGAAKIQQGLLSSGLYNSSIKSNADTQQFYKTSQALAGVDESIGQMLAGLEKETTAAKVSANDAMSQAYGQKFSSLGNVFSELASDYTGKSYTPTSYNFGGLGYGLSKLLQQNELNKATDQFYNDSAWQMLGMDANAY